MNKELKIAYFGGEPIGVPILNELEKAGIIPGLIICNPDRPIGRKQILTSPPVKDWAVEKDIEVWQPEDFKDENSVTEKLKGFDLFVVVAYNKILPKWLIEIPEHKTINVHPSLLPLLRGASPIRSTILNDMKDECGVTVMLMDEKMDHGPILSQEKISFEDNEWPVGGSELDARLSELGGKLLAETIPKYISGEIIPKDQDHDSHTHCGRLERSVGEIELNPHNLPNGDEAYKMLLKIKAFEEFPGTFFIHEGKRVKVTKAQITEGNLCLERVIPEGKQEMNFSDYLSSI